MRRDGGRGFGGAADRRRGGSGRTWREGEELAPCWSRCQGKGGVGAASREAVAGEKVPMAAATAGGAVVVALEELPTDATLGAAVGSEGRAADLACCS